MIGIIPDDLNIRQHLGPETMSAPDVKAWRAEAFADTLHNSLLFGWCTFWAERAHSAQNFQEQALTHSLILQRGCLF